MFLRRALNLLAETMKVNFQKISDGILNGFRQGECVSLLFYIYLL
jgi:hypothetical protein